MKKIKGFHFTIMFLLIISIALTIINCSKEEERKTIQNSEEQVSTQTKKIVYHY